MKISDLSVTVGSALGLHLTTAEVCQTEEEALAETDSSQQSQHDQVCSQVSHHVWMF